MINASQDFYILVLKYCCLFFKALLFCPKRWFDCRLRCQLLLHRFFFFFFLQLSLSVFSWWLCWRAAAWRLCGCWHSAALSWGSTWCRERHSVCSWAKRSSAKSYLSPIPKHIGSVGVRFPLPCTVAQFPLVDWEVVDFYSWLHS